MVLLVASGIAYQRVAGGLNLSGYPMPGRLIDVGSHKLHLHCSGSGSPTVVLESGAGSGMLAWRSVQPAVAERTRVCSYDRAGYGWSDLSLESRTIHRVAEELRMLLEKSGEESPFILASHSLGGVYAQFFATSYSDLVAGLILVDATHEDTFKSLPSFVRWADWIVKIGQELRVAGVSRLYPQSRTRPFERSPTATNSWRR